jgi:YVTN family beta-propeller protein
MKFLFMNMLLAVMKIACAATLSSLPGMPPVPDPNNIYADASANMFSPAVQEALNRVYVPNSLDNTVSVIDPKTHKVVDTFKVGKLPQHVVPSYDLKTLWVLNNHSNSMIPINPNTAKPGMAVNIEDPYNLYFTPDGRYVIGVSEEYKQLNFYDSKTMKLYNSVHVDCAGVNHMNFTADGRFAVATCEFSAQLLKLDLAYQKILGYLSLSMPMQSSVVKELQISRDGNVSLVGDAPHGSMPQDVRLSPDGSVFYVADMMMNGLILIDPVQFKKIGFIPTGVGTHSVYQAVMAN